LQYHALPCTASQLSNELVLLLQALPAATDGITTLKRNEQCVCAPVHVFLQASSHPGAGVIVCAPTQASSITGAYYES
jgi:hypothetical protein